MVPALGGGAPPTPVVADGEGNGGRHLEQEGGTGIRFQAKRGRGAHQREPSMVASLGRRGSPVGGQTSGCQWHLLGRGCVRYMGGALGGAADQLGVSGVGLMVRHSSWWRKALVPTSFLGFLAVDGVGTHKTPISCANMLSKCIK
jgi:hypothetical protein